MVQRFFLLIIFFCLITNFSLSKKSIVVTGYNIKLIVQEITGDSIDVTNLIAPNVSLHTFSPKPSEVKKLKSADFLIYLSDEVDFWVKKFRSDNILELISLVPKEYLMFFDEKKGHILSKSFEKGDGDIDPHFWLNPVIVSKIVPMLLERIVKLDPKNSGYYKANASKFIDKLKELDKKVISKLSKFKGESVILFHPSFRYFLKQYNLNYIGSIEESPGKEPSPKMLIDIVKRIRENNVKAIFIEPQLSDKAAKSIAREAKIKVLTLDPIGNYSQRNSYEKLLMYNVNTFVEAFERK